MDRIEIADEVLAEHGLGRGCCTIRREVISIRVEAASGDFSVGVRGCLNPYQWVESLNRGFVSMSAMLALGSARFGQQSLGLGLFG
ncbi:hypothetical protein [Saccharopolyspora sp. NPDC050642]|uniref:hypothetical protein n=1 Tax=Saccharopolyspora sp. NPDC050642 TaxID=3157099 RepID=UPI0033C52011